MRPPGSAWNRRNLICRKFHANCRLHIAGTARIILTQIMLTRAIKVFAARIGIVALLFSQLVVAAYACPAVMNRGELANVMTAEDMHAAMPDCEMSGSGNPNLCLEYSQAGSQAVQSTPQQPLPAVVMTPLAFVVLPQPASLPGIVAQSLLPERETSPPPLLRFGFLRI
jgi:hypothetical protein